MVKISTSRLNPSQFTDGDQIGDPTVSEVAGVQPIERHELQHPALRSAVTLRPPELLFSHQARLGGPRFEEQAIRGVETLKLQGEVDTLDSLARLVLLHREDVLMNGSDAAIRGLNTLDTFIQQSALLYAIKKGQMA